ncbi:cytochrome c [Acidovorax sp. Be4]|uniref:Cytochrome c n=1 Tax=Acidovorax bellezanensis TaxID=2976702 RepID=A0ABT2PP96_9BURK|nr:cytochrome c [Acidovorax sp. Be4]MCT9812105.1 cytochrome c [Acidovorax sp. Be4]
MRSIHTLTPALTLCAVALGLALPAAATAAAPAADIAAGATSSDPVARGRYLATAGDCVACHTAPGGVDMAGGLALASPLGPIYSTNITPSKTHGIGNYTLQQFSDALRHGKRADGAYLYPAMPYTAYAKTTDVDIADMYAYFMQGVRPVDRASPPTALPFPFNIRLSMGVWNAMFHDDKAYQANDQQPPEWNRGAYLVQGLAHCSTCHTPRNALMAEIGKKALSGGEVGPWYAPNITSDTKDGIGEWTPQELVDYMRNGHVVGKGSSGGPMAEAIDHSLSHLSDADLRAIAGYLHTVPAVSEGSTQPAFSWGKASDQLDSIRGVALPKDMNAMTGPQLYDGNCASCHQAQGQGSSDGKLPALFHNSTLGHKNTNNLVLAILEGVPRHGRDSIMPAFAHELSDQQIATLSNYLLQAYGRPDAKVTTDQVQRLRSGAQDNTLLTMARVAMAVGALVLLALVIWLFSRRNRPSTP